VMIGDLHIELGRPNDSARKISENDLEEIKKNEENVENRMSSYLVRPFSVDDHEKDDEKSSFITIALEKIGGIATFEKTSFKQIISYRIPCTIFPTQTRLLRSISDEECLNNVRRNSLVDLKVDGVTDLKSESADSNASPKSKTEDPTSIRRSQLLFINLFTLLLIYK